jgi:pSer/pThr/pTyr-binding forkhead associated (FHA) protein
MELKLVVLAGAKQGTEIPLKKDQFIIGRAKECHLRAGSEAISRRHCAIARSKEGWTVRDLGSRNGTHVNDARIEKAVPLRAGDELRVGPLRFRIDRVSAKVLATEASAPLAAQMDSKPHKQPPVKDVADVVERTFSKSAVQTSEDDISNWLLGVAETTAGDPLKETRTISMQDTKSLTRMGTPLEPQVSASTDESQAAGESVIAADETVADKSAQKSGGWGFFKRGKPGTKKAPPGKLPPRTDQQSKDSREAAADIIRQMQRRR